MSTSSSAQPSSHKRIRSRRACLPCQQRKRKCDGNNPCSSCDGYGYTCVYDKADALPTPQSTPPMQDVELRHRITCVAGDVIESIRKHVLPTPAAQDIKILDATKSRFYGRHAAIAFPHLLGLELQADPVPKLACHAWNVEVRERPRLRTITHVTEVVDALSAKKYIQTFFDRVHPVYGFLDLDSFNTRCARLWGGDGSKAFASLAASVIALGSYFSDEPLENEAEVSKLVDDMINDPAETYDLEPCHIGAMIYNSLYMRLTSGHLNTWARSCTTMHSIESLGLHKDFEELSKAAGTPQILGDGEATYRSKMFWVAWSLNHHLAVEAGRSPVVIEDSTVKYPFPPSDESATGAMCELAKLMPKREITHLQHKSTREQSQWFADLLKGLRKIKRHDPVVALNAADVASSVYRRMLVAGVRQNIPHQISDLSAIYEDALSAAETILRQGLRWWHLVDTLFQLTCVLVSLDTPQTVGLLRRAMQLQDSVNAQFATVNTHDARETCRVLVRALAAKKRRDLDALDSLTIGEMAELQQPEESIEQTMMSDDPMFANADFPNLFSQMPGAFDWTGNSGVEWNYPQEF